MYNLCNPAWGQEPLSVCVQEQDMDVYPSILPSLHPEYSYSTKKNSDVSIAAPPNPPDHFCSAQQPQRRSYRQATARRNKFKAPAPARGGRRVNSCYWVIFFFRRAQTKPLCVRNNSYSWAEQSETSIHKLVPPHPLRALIWQSAGSSSACQSWALHCHKKKERKKNFLNQPFNQKLSLQTIYLEKGHG